MKSRWILLLGLVAGLAAAPTAFAAHHEGAAQGHGKAMKKAKDARATAGDVAEDAREAAGDVAEDARKRADEANQGRGAEMRERRDQRKAIMQDAKSTAEPGTPRKGKKPWWRFWESEADAAN